MINNMYITGLGHYLPTLNVPNSYFLNLNGLTDEWIYTRTGIKNRLKATPEENTNTMGYEAVKNLINRFDSDLSDVDLIIGASYSPYDTVATLAHYVQRKFNIENAKAIYISTACSSFINAMELAEVYFAAGKASKALVIASEHNTAYSNEKCDKSGHLWGDGAAALLVEKEKPTKSLFQVIDISTQGLGHEGKGTKGVFLRPGHGGLEMPHGRDVFINACTIMAKVLVDILDKNNYNLSDVNYVIPHQANIRIIDHIAKELKIEKKKVITNIENHGNTGCASTLIGLSMYDQKIEPESLVAFTVFGGGYSSGAMLIKA